MQRFKRKSTLATENNSDSDENKIRRQLLLDLDYFKLWAVSYDIEIVRVEALISRANLPAESSKIPGPIHSVPDMADVGETV